MTALYYRSARDLVDLMRRGEASVSEVMAAHLERIEKANPLVNAICTLDPERARARARALDKGTRGGPAKGLLHGLPVAIKDLTPTRDFPTSYGSPIYAGSRPEENALYVDRLEAAGAIVIGKTNTPEFGAGSQTFNRVFGATRNPYDLTRTAGGSSGGAGAALACGMLPIADGTDFGGSIRNPANFNNAVGLRPTPGRVPRYPTQEAWDTLVVAGPLARSVQDAALMLEAMAGADDRDPISLPDRPRYSEAAVDMDTKNARVAWSRDLGQFPVEREVIAVIEGALRRLPGGVDEAHPDFSGARDIFQVLRAQSFAAGHAAELRAHRAQLKDTVIWNIEQGLKLTVEDVARANAGRSLLYQRVRTFFEQYDFLLLPVSQVTPFPIEIEWVREIEGIAMETYVDWMMSCALITLTSHPSLSLPCGFTGDGLPVGVQIVGRYRDELGLIKFARAFEDALDLPDRRPALPGIDDHSTPHAR